MHEKTLIKVYSEKYNIEGLIEDYGIVVNTDETVHTARSRSAFVPVNRARRQNVFHISSKTKDCSAFRKVCTELGSSAIIRIY